MDSDESAESTTESTNGSADEASDELEDDSPPTPGPLADDLASDGYRRTGSECKESDCEGLLWYSENMLVCDRCSSSVDLEARRSASYTENPWDRYQDSPPRYRNSGKVRMPGGFLSGYDWLNSDDVDGVISDVDPDEFYR